MIQSTTCPDTIRLRDLLDGMLPDADLERLTRHLDDCPDCRQRLETLAVGGAVPANVRQLGCWRDEAGPAFERVMSELTHPAQADIDTRPETSPEEPILSFLSPSDHPG